MQAQFKLGELVSYRTPNYHSGTCYARILAIKFDDKGVYYQMSDHPADVTQRNMPESWVEQSRVCERFVVA